MLFILIFFLCLFVFTALLHPSPITLARVAEPSLPLTTSHLLPAATENAAASEALHQSIASLLQKTAEPSLSLTVREAISNAGQQGLEEVVEKIA